MEYIKPSTSLLRTMTAVFTFGLLAAVFMTSCSSPYYAVQSNHAPLLQEEGELKVEAGATVHPRTLSYDIKAAYSPMENLQVMLSTTSMERSVRQRGYGSVNQQITAGLKGVYTEGAVGYYGEFNNTKAAMSVGYGFANARSRGENTIVETTLDYSNVFIQPTLGIRSENFEWINSLRLSRLSFGSVQADSIPSRAGQGSLFYLNDVSRPVSGANYLMMQPSSAILLGFNQLKFKLQVTLGVPLQDYVMTYDGLGFGVGLTYNFKPSTADQGFAGQK